MFVNRPSLGFDEAEQEQATQEFEIGEAKVGEPLELRLVRFQGVQSLHVRSLSLFLSLSHPTLPRPVFFFRSASFDPG